MKEIYIRHIAGLLQLKDWQVENCVEMFADGDTIPFISRYRKEKTGGMDDAQVAEVRHWADVFDEMEKRKETVLKTIDEAGALTDELRGRIEACVSATELEDLYLPWRPKRRTRATAAREKGLEPLADAIWNAVAADPATEAAAFVGDKVGSAEEALSGARDIIAERRKNGMQGSVSRKLAAEIRSAGCKALLIRGWEDKAALEAQVRELFPGQDVCVCSLPELKREGPRGAGLIAVLQIEAFCQGDDFRGDEKAMQLAAMLGSLAPRVIIQTSTISRFVPGRSADALLEERREFSYPPYTRLVEVRRYGDRSVQQRFFLPKDASLPERKLEIAASVPEDCYADVDPL